MPRLLVLFLTGFGSAVAWLSLTFFGGPAHARPWWLGRLVFSPAVYVRRHLLPGGPAWLFGRESQGSVHQFDLLVTVTLWTGVFTLLAVVVIASHRRRTRRLSERV